MIDLFTSFVENLGGPWGRYPGRDLTNLPLPRDRELRSRVGQELTSRPDYAAPPTDERSEQRRSARATRQTESLQSKHRGSGPTPRQLGQPFW